MPRCGRLFAATYAFIPPCSLSREEGGRALCKRLHRTSASIIRMVNKRYGTALKEFVPTEDALNSVQQTVEWMAQRDSMMTEWDYRRGVALPSEQRRRAKDARRSEYLDERNKPLRLTAESLYERGMQYSRN